MSPVVSLDGAIGSSSFVMTPEDFASLYGDSLSRCTPVSRAWYEAHNEHKWRGYLNTERVYAIRYSEKHVRIADEHVVRNEVYGVELMVCAPCPFPPTSAEARLWLELVADESLAAIAAERAAASVRQAFGMEEEQ